MHNPEGDFAQAESEVIQLLQNNLSKLDNDNELFISFIDALFVLQRLDLVAAMLQDRYGFTKPLRLLIAKNGSGVGLVRWRILPLSEGREHQFIFDANVFNVDDTRQEILAFHGNFLYWPIMQMPLNKRREAC